MFDDGIITLGDGFIAVDGEMVSGSRQWVQDITEVDARAEGVDSVTTYQALWESINGKTKGARWQDNPWVWVYEFVFVPAEVV